MKVLLLTNPGIEEVSKKEVNELLDVPENKIKTIYGGILFDVKSFQEIVYLCYLCRSARRILYYFSEFDDAKKLESIKFEKEFVDFFDETTTFSVRLEKNKKSNFDKAFSKSLKDVKNATNEFEKAVADKIFELLEKGKIMPKVDLKKPQVPVIAYISDSKTYLGIDFAGFDLSTRPYRAFNNPRELKSNICYSISRIAEFNGSEKIAVLDCLSGIIPIEAALHSNYKSVFYYNKKDFSFHNFLPLTIINTQQELTRIDSEMLYVKTNVFALSDDVRSVNATNKNAKVCNIAEAFNISKVALDFLDTKFDKNSLDSLIVQRIDNFYEVFNQAKYVLRKGGNILLILYSKKEDDKISKIAKENGFSLENEYEIETGNSSVFLRKFLKKK